MYELTSIYQHSIVITTLALQQAAPCSKAARSVRYQTAINERLKAAIKWINALINPGFNDRCLNL
jgi:hypothetical protein